MNPKLISAPGVFLLGGGVRVRGCVEADPEAIYIWIYFKEYVMKIVLKSPIRHLVRLQGI